MFNCFGPMNERARNDMPVLSEMMHYARTHAVPGKLNPGSWAEAIHHLPLPARCRRRQCRY
ncbi:MAG TPA: hypothetical protein VKB76_19355 [Ktedonobacterales bacterium]|nr:hypothetical protein [Ktedonobacterales bacterium]